MPWSESDVSEFREGLTEAQKEKWVEIANGVLEDCLEAGGDRRDCEAKAIRVANGEFESKEASVLDLERLDERYVVIGAEGQPPHGEVDDLRELDGDFGDGVYPLWSDELQSIVAWAFSKSLWERPDAERWVAEATEAKGASLMDIVKVVAATVGESIARSLGLRREEPVAAKTAGGWYVSPVRDLPLADEATEWGWSTEASNEVLGDDDWERFAMAHLLVDMSQADEGEEWPTNKGAYKLPVAKMVGGELEYVWNGAAAANAALSGARSELDAPEEAKGSAAEVLRRIYGKFDKDPENVSAAQMEPRTLMAFSSKLQSGEEAEPDEDDGLVWKEIIHPGQWYKMNSGRVVEVTADIIRAAHDAFRAGLPKFVSVPAGSYHPDSVAAEENRGFVHKLKLVGDRLFGGFKFTNPDTKQAVEEGSIADCSVYLEPEVTHPETGEQFPWALTHVLLTNNPLVQDLEPFGAPIPASASGNVRIDLYVQTEEEVPMSDQENTDITLSAEDQSLLDNAKELGLTADDIRAMVAERERVKEKTRDLEVTGIVRALEAQDEHELVVQVDGTRHWPVVVAAVEKALLEQPHALGMSAKDGRTDLDEVVLDVVNAIPADARMKVGGQPRGSKDPEDPTLEAGGEDTLDVKDAKAKALAGELTPRKGAAVGVSG